MTSENNETIVFRHGAHSLMLGLALFAIVGAYAIFALSLGLFGGLEGSRVFAPKNTGAWNYLVVPYLLIVIYALNRIRLGVFRKPMAEISSQGIRVHRLLSQRFMAWAGVAAVEVVWGNTIRVADLLKNPDPAAFGGFRLVPKNWDAWKNPFIEIAPRGWGVPDEVWWDALARHRGDLFTPAMKTQINKMHRDHIYPVHPLDVPVPLRPDTNADGATTADPRGWTG